MKRVLFCFGLMYLFFGVYSNCMGSGIDQWLGAYLLGFLCLFFASYHRTANKYIKIIPISLVAGTSFFLITFLGFYLWNTSQVKQESYEQIKYVMVFGASIKEGNVSPSLQARLDKTLDVIRQLPKATIIVTGGKGNNEYTTEAFLMKNYLLSKGIGGDQILLEDRATSTAENIRYSKPILLKNGFQLSEPIGVLSNDFHLARIQMLCNRYGLHPVMMAAPTPWFEVPRCYVREYFATVKSYLFD